MQGFAQDPKNFEWFCLWHRVLRLVAVSNKVKTKLNDSSTATTATTTMTTTTTTTTTPLNVAVVTASDLFSDCICSKSFLNRKYSPMWKSQIESLQSEGNWHTKTDLDKKKRKEIRTTSGESFSLVNPWQDREKSTIIHFKGTSDCFDGMMTLVLVDDTGKKDTCLWIEGKRSALSGRGSLTPGEVKGLLAALEKMKQAFPEKHHLLLITTNHDSSDEVQNLIRNATNDVALISRSNDGLLWGFGYAFGSPL